MQPVIEVAARVVYGHFQATPQYRWGQLEAALGVVDAWLEHPRAHLIAPTTRHAAVLSGLLLGAGVGGNLVSDAHLAALAIEHGAELGSFDRDFQRFAGLRLTVLK